MMLVTSVIISESTGGHLLIKHYKGPSEGIRNLIEILYTPYNLTSYACKK